MFFAGFTGNEDVAQVNDGEKKGRKRESKSCWNVWARFFRPNKGMKLNLKRPNGMIIAIFGMLSLFVDTR